MTRGEAEKRYVTIVAAAPVRLATVHRRLEVVFRLLLAFLGFLLGFLLFAVVGGIVGLLTFCGLLRFRRFVISKIAVGLRLRRLLGVAIGGLLVRLAASEVSLDPLDVDAFLVRTHIAGVRLNTTSLLILNRLAIEVLFAESLGLAHGAVTHVGEEVADVDGTDAVDLGVLAELG